MQLNASQQNRDVTKHPKCLHNLYNYFAEYCENTSIHGFKFLGEKKRSIFERVFWLIFLCASLYFCIGSILEAYQKWELSPVVVSFATSETAVWKIPFPAVTICPQIKNQKSLVNFTKLALKKRSGAKLDLQETKQLEYLSLICSTKWNLFNDANSTEIIDGDDLTDFLFKVQPKFNATVHECYWSGRNCSENIDNLFTPILTKEGFCFSFNLLDRDEVFTSEINNDYYNKFAIPHQASSKWSLEKGYEDGSDLDSFPRRAIIGGVHGGLDLTFYLNSSDLDYLCADALQGFKIILHNPTQIPYVKQRYFRVGLNQDVTAGVKPTIMTTSKQLKKYKPWQRKCFFGEEKKLRFFKVYDQHNCLHECLSNFTQKHCGCVGFSMIRDKVAPVCGLGKQDCIQEASAMFLAKEVKFRMQHQQRNSKQRNRPAKNYIKNCNCFPTCNSLTFEAEISQSEWNWQESAKILNNNHHKPNFDQYSRIQIFFKDMQFITSERNELYGRMDFLASCGGLLGLFIGFSFLSIVEIVYYVTLRLFCNIRKYGSGNWPGKSEIVDVKIEV